MKDDVARTVKQPVIFGSKVPTITEENFLIFSASHYANPACYSTEEFLDDIKRIRYLKKLFTTYKKGGDLKERLVMNHIVVLFNVFEGRALIRMLFFKLDGFWEYLTPFLIAINRLPEFIEGVREDPIPSNSIKLDYVVSQKIRKILREGSE